MSATSENASSEDARRRPERASTWKPELLGRRELMGKRVRLSDGRTGEVVHVEYEAPGRVALVKTFPENPSPLTRAAVDRYSPAHLPAITEIIPDAPPG
jgi:hypothetical protein